MEVDTSLDYIFFRASRARRGGAQACKSKKMLAIKDVFTRKPAVLEVIEELAQNNNATDSNEAAINKRARVFLRIKQHSGVASLLKDCRDLQITDKKTLQRWFDQFIASKDQILAVKDEKLLKQLIRQAFTPTRHRGRTSQLTKEYKIFQDLLLSVTPDFLTKPECKILPPELMYEFRGRDVWTLKLLSQVLRVSPATVATRLKELNISLTDQRKERRK